jgi:hypothetical protein
MRPEQPGCEPTCASLDIDAAIRGFDGNRQAVGDNQNPVHVIR